MRKNYNLEIRFVDFVTDCISFVRTIGYSYEEKYCKQQLIRSSGGSALNFGEAIGCRTDKDFIHKLSIVLKELKETRMNLKILDRLTYGTENKRKRLLGEVEELAAITSAMIRNKTRN